MSKFSLIRRGALAGALATVPMTVAMRTLHRALPPDEQYPLPPEVLTAVAAESAHVRAEPDAPGWEWKTYAGHFGYGAAMGAAYAATQRYWRRNGLGVSPMRRGMLYGLAVWGGSYLGWIPAFNMPAAAKDEPPARNAVMIASHLVWGAANGVLCSQLADNPELGRCGTRAENIRREIANHNTANSRRTAPCSSGRRRSTSAG